MHWKQESTSTKNGDVVLIWDVEGEGWTEVGVIADPNEVSFAESSGQLFLSLDRRKAIEFSTLLEEASDTAVIVVATGAPGSNGNVLSAVREVRGDDEKEWQQLASAVLEGAYLFPTIFPRTCKNHPKERRPCRFGF